MEEDSHTSLEGEPSTSKAHINLVSNEEHFTTSDLGENYYVDSNVQLPKDTSDDESSSSSSESSSSSSESSTSSSALVDSDDSVKDKDYVPESELLGTTGKDQNNDSDEYSGDQSGNEGILNSPAKKKGFKRKRNPQTWYRNAQKKLRNEGKSYKMASKNHRERPARAMKPPCTEKCRLKCFSTFSNEERKTIFSDYWQLGSLEKQRLFILNCMEQIQPSYRYIRVGGNRPPRKLNNAFFFNVDGEKKRVCKVFFKNTLDINDRPIRTVQEKRAKVVGVLMEPEKRGQHTKTKGLDQSTVDKVRKHIDSIPRIESHYLRGNTSRQFIDGSKTVSELHRDYVNICKEEKVEYVNYAYYYNIFKNEYNISFFCPKKDQCDTCEAFENATDDE